MKDLYFVAVGFSIVGLLCIVIWFDHKRREKRDSHKRRLAQVLELPPYFSDDYKRNGWLS